MGAGSALGSAVLPLPPEGVGGSLTADGRLGPVAGQFFEAGRLDELLITYMPVALGRGRPLLPLSKVTAPLKLTSVRQLGDAVEHVYRIG